MLAALDFPAVLREKRGQKRQFGRIVQSIFQMIGRFRVGHGAVSHRQTAQKMGGATLAFEHGRPSRQVAVKRLAGKQQHRAARQRLAPVKRVIRARRFFPRAKRGNAQRDAAASRFARVEKEAAQIRAPTAGGVRRTRDQFLFQCKRIVHLTSGMRHSSVTGRNPLSLSVIV